MVAGLQGRVVVDAHHDLVVVHDGDDQLLACASCLAESQTGEVGGEVDLAEAVGVDHVAHQGRGVRRFHALCDQVAEEFLRGQGLIDPEVFQRPCDVGGVRDDGDRQLGAR